MRFNVGNASDNDIKLLLIVETETETTFGCNENMELLAKVTINLFALRRGSI